MVGKIALKQKFTLGRKFAGVSLPLMGSGGPGHEKNPVNGFRRSWS